MLTMAGWQRAVGAVAAVGARHRRRSFALCCGFRCGGPRHFAWQPATRRLRIDDITITMDDYFFFACTR